MPKAEQRAYLVDVLKATLDPKMTALPHNFHPETHNEEGFYNPRYSVLRTSMMGIEGDNTNNDGTAASMMPTMDSQARLTPAGSWVMYVPVGGGGGGGGVNNKRARRVDQDYTTTTATTTVYNNKDYCIDAAAGGAV